MAINTVEPHELMFNRFEPKTQNRFVMYIDGIPAYLVRKASRPALAQAEVTLKHINVERYLKGRSSWQAMSGVEIYDPIVPSAAQAVMEWVRLHHESVTGRDGYAAFYKKDIVFNMLDPVGAKVEEWKLFGAQLINIDFGEINWEDDHTPVLVSCDIRYDYAVLNY